MLDVEHSLPADLRIRAAGLPGPRPGWITHWVRLMVEWRKLLDRYSQVAEDEGWCWGERASVGFLTSAAWNAGGVSLQEHGTFKQGVRDRRRRYQGTADLLLRFGERTFAVEAKYKELRIDTGRSKTTMKAVFERAGWDSLRDTQGVNHRVAIAFLPLVVARDEWPNRRQLQEQHMETPIDLKEFSFHRRLRVDLFPAWSHEMYNKNDFRYLGKTVLIGIDDV